MVEVGQVYRDKDKRMSNRYVCVWLISNDKAHCFDSTKEGRQLTSRSHKVRLSNLEKRFELVEPKDSLAA